MAYNEIYKATIELNSKQAQDNIKALREEQKKAMEELSRLKRLDTNATKEQIKAAEQHLKHVTNDIKNEERHIRGLSLAMDNLTKKNYKELQKEVRTLSALSF